MRLYHVVSQVMQIVAEQIFPQQPWIRTVRVGDHGRLNNAESLYAHPGSQNSIIIAGMADAVPEGCFRRKIIARLRYPQAGAPGGGLFLKRIARIVEKIAPGGDKGAVRAADFPARFIIQENLRGDIIHDYSAYPRFRETGAAFINVFANIRAGRVVPIGSQLDVARPGDHVGDIAQAV